jgi:hypothetical protein
VCVRTAACLASASYQRESPWPRALTAMPLGGLVVWGGGGLGEREEEGSGARRPTASIAAYGTVVSSHTTTAIQLARPPSTPPQQAPVTRRHVEVPLARGVVQRAALAADKHDVRGAPVGLKDVLGLIRDDLRGERRAVLGGARRGALLHGDGGADGDGGRAAAGRGRGGAAGRGAGAQLHACWLRGEEGVSVQKGKRWVEGGVRGGGSGLSPLLLSGVVFVWTRLRGSLQRKQRRAERACPPPPKASCSAPWLDCSPASRSRWLHASIHARPALPWAGLCKNPRCMPNVGTVRASSSAAALHIGDSRPTFRYEVCAEGSTSACELQARW